MFVYNVEVLGLPAGKAADLAGMSRYLVSKPHLQQARDNLRREMRGTVNITKDDVLCGIRDAIDHARHISEPATQIAGWKQISLMLGYDSPARIDINLRESVTAVQHVVRGFTDAQLVELLGAGSVIDGQFYEVKDQK